MAPRKPPVKRKTPIPRGSESDASINFDQIFSERLAASMPDLVSKISESILQSLGGSTPRGTGAGAGGSGTGAGQTVIIEDPPKGCTYKTFMGCKPPEFKGTEGATDTIQWMEKIESVFEVCGCADEDRVRYATFMFQGLALTWWNTIVRTRGRGEIGIMTWEQLRAILTEEYVPENEVQRLEQELWNLTMQGADIRGYTNRFYELSQLVPYLVRPETKRVNRFIHGLPQQIRDNVIASRPGTLQSAIVVASTLTDSMVRGGLMPTSEDKKNAGCKRGRDDSGKKSVADPLPIQSYAAVIPEKAEYRGTHPKCAKCSRHHSGDRACWVCSKCNRLGHTEKFCKGCFECGSLEHRRDKCPKLGKSADGARGRAYVIGTQ